MIALAMLISLAQQKSSFVPDKDTKDLDPKTRPYVEIQMFKNMKCVSINQYRSVDERTKKTIVNRVYRFTYKAVLADEAKRWQTNVFKKSDGWKVTSELKAGFIMERDTKDPKVRTQALLLNTGQLVFDINSRAHVKVMKNPAWVRVSYNEIMRSNQW